MLLLLGVSIRRTAEVTLHPRAASSMPFCSPVGRSARWKRKRKRKKNSKYTGQRANAGAPLQRLFQECVQAVAAELLDAPPPHQTRDFIVARRQTRFRASGVAGGAEKGGGKRLRGLPYTSLAPVDTQPLTEELRTSLPTQTHTSTDSHPPVCFTENEGLKRFDG